MGETIVSEFKRVESTKIVKVDGGLWEKLTQKQGFNTPGAQVFLNAGNSDAKAFYRKLCNLDAAGNVVPLDAEEQAVQEALAPSAQAAELADEEEAGGDSFEDAFGGGSVLVTGLMFLVCFLFGGAAMAQNAKVTGVAVGNFPGPHSIQSIPDSGEQMRTPAVGGVNLIKVTFTQNVPVQEHQIRVRFWNEDGTAGPFIPIDHIVFSVQNSLLEIHLTQTIYKGRLRLTMPIGSPQWLLGEWHNPSNPRDTDGDKYPSGPGNTQFQFNMNILSADFNHDNRVNGDDFLIWQANFGTQAGANQTMGDANGDGAVDGDDNLLIQTQWGTNYWLWP